MLSTEEKIMSRKVIEFVSQSYMIAESDIFTGRRWFPDVEARYVCFFLMQKYIFQDDEKNLAIKKIASYFHIKNRNIIKYALRKINFEWLKFDRRFQEQFNKMNQNFSHEND